MNDQQRQRRGFEARLAADPYDETTHKVFADWLEEHGLDDEAAWQRSWTAERQRAEEWLREFAGRCGTANWDGRPITYEDVIDAGRRYVESGGNDWFTQYGSQDAPELMWHDATREEYWRCWELVTGKKASGELRDGSPFSCSC